MQGTQLSMFAEHEIPGAGAPTPRVRRATRPSLAALVAATMPAHDPESHAHAVDAVLTAASPRITRIARLFIPSWPVAHVDVDDLTQEVLLEVAASVHWAPCESDDQVQAWLSALAMRVLYDLWRAATQDARDHRDALSQFAVELESDDSAPDAADDESAAERYYTQAA